MNYKKREGGKGIGKTPLLGAKEILKIAQVTSWKQTRH